MTKDRDGYYSMAAIRYAKVLYELGLKEEIIETARQVFEEVPRMQDILESPVIEAGKKHRIIDRSFPKEIRSFLKVVADHGKSSIIPEIFRAYEDRKNEMAGIVTVRLSYVTAPSEEQLEKLKDFVCNRYHAADVRWELRECPELIGGFILHVNGREYDYSMQGRLKRLEQKLTWR